MDAHGCRMRGQTGRCTIGADVEVRRRQLPQIAVRRLSPILPSVFGKPHDASSVRNFHEIQLEFGRLVQALQDRAARRLKAREVLDVLEFECNCISTGLQYTYMATSTHTHVHTCLNVDEYLCLCA